MILNPLWSVERSNGSPLLSCNPYLLLCPSRLPRAGERWKASKEICGLRQTQFSKCRKEKGKKKKLKQNKWCESNQWAVAAFQKPPRLSFFCWAHAVQCGISLGLAGVKLCPLPASASPQPTHWESRTGKRESLGAVQASLTTAKTVCCQHCSGHRPPVEHPTDCSQHN